MIITKSELTKEIDAENERRAELLDRQINARLNAEYVPFGEPVRFEVASLGQRDGAWFATLLYRLRKAGWTVDTEAMVGGIVLLIR